MSAPTRRETRRSAAGSVRRRHRNMVRQHWLTAALVFALIGVGGYSGLHLYQLQERLESVRASRLQLEQQLQESKGIHSRLESDLSRVTDDSYMELMAKALGFVYPQETVYQTGGR